VLLIINFVLQGRSSHGSRQRVNVVNSMVLIFGVRSRRITSVEVDRSTFGVVGGNVVRDNREVRFSHWNLVSAILFVLEYRIDS
jgi:hypothetical protein